jgi:VWFA-related protein
MEGQSILEEIASITGGRAFYPRDKKEMVEVFLAINAELHNQYRIGFRPGQLELPDKWRQIKLKIRPVKSTPEFKNLSFRTRQGYYTK